MEGCVRGVRRGVGIEGCVEGSIEKVHAPRLRLHSCVWADVLSS